MTIAQRGVQGKYAAAQVGTPGEYSGRCWQFNANAFNGLGQMQLSTTRAYTSKTTLNSKLEPAIGHALVSFWNAVSVA